MFISTNGISTYYERSGCGFPVVLIHALGMSVRSWDPIVPELSRRYEVIAYDWRGHGRSEKVVAEYSLSCLAQDLEALLDGLGCPQAFLIGLAVGAMIAQQAALDHPEMVAGLVLAGSLSGLEQTGVEYMESRASTVEQEGMRAVVNTTIERCFAPGFAETHREVMRTFRGEYLANDPLAYAEASRMVARLNATRRLEEIRCPTLLLAGEMDSLSPPEVSRNIQRRIEKSQLEVIPRVGHFSAIESPDRFVAHVLTFLARIDRETVGLPAGWLR